MWLSHTQACMSTSPVSETRRVSLARFHLGGLHSALAIGDCPLCGGARRFQHTAAAAAEWQCRKHLADVIHRSADKHNLNVHCLCVTPRAVRVVKLPPANGEKSHVSHRRFCGVWRRRQHVTDAHLSAAHRYCINAGGKWTFVTINGSG